MATRRKQRPAGPYKPHHPPGGIGARAARRNPFRHRTHRIVRNTRAVVEGCKGILEYEDDVIRLNTASGIIRFMGKNLGMNCLNEDSAVVEGKILSVEFMS